MPDLLQEHIRSVLRTNEEYYHALAAAIRDTKAKGYRIVSGGYTGPTAWQIKDWGTSEIIAEGQGKLDEAWDQASRDGHPWRHYDAVEEDVSVETPYTDGLPKSLCDVLAEWVARTSTTDEEIALVAGVNVNDIHR